MKRSAQEFENEDIESNIPKIEKLISDKKALEYLEGKRPKPIDQLNSAMDETREKRNSTKVGNAVVFWFKNDLRTYDNKGLSRAYELAKSENVPLICIYTVCPEEYRNHVYSIPKIDFLLRSVKVVKEDLTQVNIPLVLKRVDKFKDIPAELLKFCKEYGSNHLFANIDYEVNELRRESRLVKKGVAEEEIAVAVNLCHDTCLVNPSELLTKTSNKPFSVFSPYYKAWVAHLCQHMELLDEPVILKDKLTTNKLVDDLLEQPFEYPDLPIDLKVIDQDYWANLWPAGEHTALKQLNNWISNELSGYRENRDMLDKDNNNNTSQLSVYISVGNLATRTCVRRAVGFQHSTGGIGQLRGIMDMNSSSVANWISEIAWRDFYKSILVSHPYICMNKPFKLKTASLAWSYNKQNYGKWISGKTGFPIVDASIRQLLKTGYMHNRGRMIVASFLTKHLLINWQWGEYFFMKHLIDGDFASNNGGWGFSSSCGVDAQPYFRIFNPYRQSERFDPSGKFIKHWVPELAHVEGNAIHDPYGRNASSIAKKNGYPEPMVSHAQARQQALDVFKANNNL